MDPSPYVVPQQSEQPSHSGVSPALAILIVLVIILIYGYSQGWFACLLKNASTSPPAQQPQLPPPPASQQPGATKA